jgi:HTH-type transcriptional regulator / antitoxin HipB
MEKMSDISIMRNDDSGTPRAMPILIATDFGGAFRRERKARGLTQQRVAEKTGLTRFTVQQLESGQNVGLHHILAALAVLGKGLSIVSARPDFDQIQEMFSEDE